MVWVRCPRCGHYFEVNMSKGKGAYYTRKDFTPSNLHVEIMKAIRTIVSQKMNGATRRDIETYLRGKGLRISGNALSGRLSELLGAGYLDIEYTQVKVYDERTKQFRFKKTPVWYLSEKGAEYILRKLAGNITQK
jgi:hypothetical protein